MHHYVILDLEMCRVQKGARGKRYNRANETIQIGAALMNENYEIIDTFNSFVKPEFGKLDTYITSFTGITWEQVNKAQSFEEVLDKFVEWIPTGEVEMVSWSDNDRYQIEGEMLAKGIINERMSELLLHWIDSQVTYAEKVHNQRCYSLEEALIACDIQTVGRMHDGADDAYNTALLFKKLMTEDELTLNTFYASAKSDERDTLSSSIGDLFAGLNWEELAAC